MLVAEGLRKRYKSREVVQDFGIRAARTFKRGNLHATFNRNVYNNRQNSLVIDNPFRASDLAYVAQVGAAYGAESDQFDFPEEIEVDGDSLSVD